jgi:hypothetical protein
LIQEIGKPMNRTKRQAFRQAIQHLTAAAADRSAMSSAIAVVVRARAIILA